MEEAGPHLAEASPPNSLSANARRLTELIQTRVIYYSQITFAMVGSWRRREQVYRSGVPSGPDRRTKIARLHQQGLSLRELAARFGISYWTVRHGITDLPTQCH